MDFLINSSTKKIQHQDVQLKQFTSKWFEAMTDINKILVFSAAVLGFDAFCEVYNLNENEELTCLFYLNILFKLFATRTRLTEDGITADY